MEQEISKLFACEMCDKTFSLKRYLTKHVARIHHVEKSTKSTPVKLPCGLCDKVFNRLSHLQRHQLAHAKIRDFSCDFCAAEFVQKEHLTKHIARKHQQTATLPHKMPLNFKETTAGQQEKSPTMFYAPSTSGVSVLGKTQLTVVIHVCRYCGFAFTEKYLLQRHVQTVHQPFECECCKKVIYGKKNFAAHERKTRRHAHICTCGMSFDKISVYKNHLMACTRKCAFECMEDDCGDTFAQRIQIDRHWLKKHYKPTICQFCDFLAEAPLRMSEHVTSVHQVNLCGYCGLHSPPPDHVALTHWQRLKRPKHKAALKNPRTSEEKDVAAILSRFSTSGSNRQDIEDEKSKPFARVYYKGFHATNHLGENVVETNNSSGKKEDDLLPNDWFQHPSSDLLDLEQIPYQTDSLLNDDETSCSGSTERPSSDQPTSTSDPQDSQKEEKEDEEEIVLHLTIPLNDDETSVKIGQHLPHSIACLFKELSQLDLRLLDPFPGSGRILSVHLPVKKPANMNDEQINDILKSINL